MVILRNLSVILAGIAVVLAAPAYDPKADLLLDIKSAAPNSDVKATPAYDPKADLLLDIKAAVPNYDPKAADLSLDPKVDLSYDPRVDPSYDRKTVTRNYDPKADLSLDPKVDLSYDPRVDPSYDRKTVTRNYDPKAADLSLDPKIDLSYDPRVDPSYDRKDVIRGQYIVRLKSGLSPAEVGSHMQWVRGTVFARRGLSERDSTGIKHVYSVGDINGYAGSFDSETLAMIRNHFQVAAIEPDTVVTLATTGPGVTTQSNSPWGLGAISHRTQGHTDYLYNTTSTAGTYAYVVDSGIRATHSEFEGRAHFVFNANPGTNDTDNMGHGTHVAGTIAGKTYGVAKQATVLSIKVFNTDNTYTPMSVLINGIAWAVNNITATPGRAAVSVINASAVGSPSDFLDDIVNHAFEKGVTTVAAAGNDGTDGETSSPARAQQAISVGGVDAQYVKINCSHWGTGVDVFAPGDHVLSAWKTGDSDSKVLGGTSMATPHVSGLVLYLKSVVGGKYLEAANVANGIQALATKGLIQKAGAGSPNLLAYNGAETSET